MVVMKWFLIQLFIVMLVTKAIQCRDAQEPIKTSTALTTLTTANHFQTRVFKTGITDNPDFTDAVTHIFEHLVCRNQLFVDNSLLIYFVSWNSRMVVTLPRAFGKTTNLDMLKFFYGMEVERYTLTPIEQKKTRAYQLFELSKIKCGNTIIKLADEFLIKSYQNYGFYKGLGSFPIVHINIGQSGIYKSINDVCELVRERIRYTLTDHRYIMRVSSSKVDSLIMYYQKEFKEIVATLDRNLCNGNTLAIAILSLIQLLHDIFERKVMVLVDEYDSILNDIFFGGSAFNATKRDDVKKFFATFYGQIIKQNIYIERVFITGILCWGGCNIFSSNTRMYFHTVREGDAINFYGMNRDIVMELLKVVNLSHTLDKVTKYYDGYHFGSLPADTTKYNPYAISRFISAKGIPKVMNFWTSTGSASSILKYITRFQNFNQKCMVLMAGRPIKIKAHSKTTTFTDKDLEDFSKDLQQARDADITEWFRMESSSDAKDFGFLILLATGYLTENTFGCVDFEKTQPSDDDYMCVKITNEEVYEDLSTDYLGIMRGGNFKAPLKDSLLWRSRLQEFGKVLALFLQDTTLNLSNFVQVFEAIIHDFIPITRLIRGDYQQNRDNNRGYANEALFKSLLTTYINYNIHDIGVEILETHQFDYVPHTRKPYVVVQTSNKLITIIELKYCRGEKFNRGHIETLLKNGTIQGIGYGDWYLEGKYSHLYKATGVKVIVLVVLEWNHRVVLKGSFKQNASDERGWYTLEHWPEFIP